MPFLLFFGLLINFKNNNKNLEWFCHSLFSARSLIGCRLREVDIIIGFGVGSSNNLCPQKKKHWVGENNQNIP